MKLQELYEGTNLRQLWDKLMQIKDGLSRALEHASNNENPNKIQKQLFDAAADMDDAVSILSNSSEAGREELMNLLDSMNDSLLAMAQDYNPDDGGDEYIAYVIPRVLQEIKGIESDYQQMWNTGVSASGDV